MFHHHDDPGFKKIIDNFILASIGDNNNSLSYIIRYIDLEATKHGISFYHMMFILIQKNSLEYRRKKKETVK
jgi:hypothetical protein